MPAARRGPKARPAARAQSARQVLREKTNITRSGANARVKTNSESEKLVKDAQSSRQRLKRPAQNEDDVYIAGGLNSPERQTRTKRPRSKGSEDAAAFKNTELGTAPRSRVQVGATDGYDGPAQALHPWAQNVPRDEGAVLDAHRRATPRSQHRRDTLRTARASGTTGQTRKSIQQARPLTSSGAADAGLSLSSLSLSPSPSPSRSPSLPRDTAMSATKAISDVGSQSTPAVENSLLALRNFKRRPRQPSMLQMVQQRRASVQASNIGDSQLPPSPDDLDLDVESLDDEFSPEMEGTPLHLGTGRFHRDHDSDALTGVRPATRLTSSAQSRKRKSNAEHLPRGLSIDARSKQSPLRSPTAHDNVQVVASSPLDSPTHSSKVAIPGLDRNDSDIPIPSTENQEERLLPADQAGNEGVEYEPRAAEMADPQSSSPVPAIEPIITQQTDIMADPLSQISPPQARKTRKKANSKPISTLTLQELLPKRRRPVRLRTRRAEYDFDLEDDDEDGEDILVRGNKTNKTSTRQTSWKRASLGASKKTAATSKQQTQANTGTKKAKQKATAAHSQPAKRTYGRGGASDQENRGEDVEWTTPPPPPDEDEDESLLPNTSLTMAEATATSAELAAVKAKFAEVDEWTMEFDDVSVGEEHRSSSQLWR